MPLVDWTGSHGIEVLLGQQTVWEIQRKGFYGKDAEIEPKYLKPSWWILDLGLWLDRRLMVISME